MVSQLPEGGPMESVLAEAGFPVSKLSSIRATFAKLRKALAEAEARGLV